MRSVCWDSRLCDWALDAFCFVHQHLLELGVSSRDSTYLRGVIEGEGGLTLDVVVSPASQRVVRADKDLSTSFSAIGEPPISLAGTDILTAPR